jgi:hypothetical protein
MEGTPENGCRCPLDPHVNATTWADRLTMDETGIYKGRETVAGCMLLQHVSQFRLLRMIPAGKAGGCPPPLQVGHHHGWQEPAATEIRTMTSRISIG